MANKFWLFLCLILSMIPSARAADKVPLQNGQDLRIIVGYASGGGYDVYARVVAQYFGKHLQGVPNVTVQNMPGGDGLVAANYMAQVAARDGSTIGITNRNFSVASLLGMLTQSNVKYDPVALNWLGDLNSEVSLFIVRADRGIINILDLGKRALQLGATGVTANNAVYPKVINKILGSNLQVVSGYPGSNHVILALERGEIDGIGGFSLTGLQAQRPTWLNEKKVFAILKFGDSSAAEVDGVPSFIDIARTTDEKDALELIAAPERMGRSFFLPPGTPGPIVAMYREAFSGMAADPEFQTASRKAGLEVTFTNGEAVQRYVAKLNAAPAHVVALARELLK